MPSLLRLLPLCILLAVSWSCQDNEKSPSEDVPPPSQPHIVFIIADDVGWDDLGIYGNKQISTPNLDQLAAEGMRLTRLFSPPVLVVRVGPASFRVCIPTTQTLSSCPGLYQRISLLLSES